MCIQQSDSISLHPFTLDRIALTAHPPGLTVKGVVQPSQVDTSKSHHWARAGMGGGRWMGGCRWMGGSKFSCLMRKLAKHC